MSLHKKGREKEGESSHHSHLFRRLWVQNFKVHNVLCRRRRYRYLARAMDPNPHASGFIFPHGSGSLPSFFQLQKTLHKVMYRIHYAVPGIFKLDPDPH